MIVAMLTQSICAQTFNDETITYKVMYKWGLINKQAGDAALSIKTVGNPSVFELNIKHSALSIHLYGLSSLPMKMILPCSFIVYT